jgi:cytochrome c oxidase subunit 3
VLEHHFENLEQQHEVATLGMWVFLATELLFFGGLFCGYMILRNRFPEGFAFGSSQLYVLLGGINTVVLLGSSLTMALAVHAARTGRKRQLVAFLGLTLFLGAVFLGIKCGEYYLDYVEDLVPGSAFDLSHKSPPGGVRSGGVELFFWLYFCMTGLHGTHMIVGMAILVILLVKARRGRFTPEYYNPIDVMGLYWHFVDIIWIFLFPLLYLIPAR